MKTITLLVLAPAILVLPSFGQITQTHPEFCGKPGRSIPLPSNLQASIDRSQGQAHLYIQKQKISLPGVINEVQEVCSLPDGRLVVFSTSGYLSEVDIIDGANPSLLDSIWGFAPVMSPNQKWLVYRKFYPRHTEFPASDEYLLYDLTKTPGQNRADGITLNNHHDVGTVIYPLVGSSNSPFDNVGLPESQQHQSASESFYWAPDSQAIVFGDRVQNRLSIVLVQLGLNGKSTASVHPVSVSDICREKAIDDPMHIESGEVDGEQGGDRLVRFKFFSTDGVCVPKTLELHSDAFHPTTPEIHVPPKRKGSIVVQE